MKGHQFILEITDYFLKWAEAVSLIKVKTSNVINFIKHYVINRFGVPRRIIHDNDLQFTSQVFYQFCNKYQIQNVALTAYNPAANGLAEAFNRTIINYSRNSFHQANEIGMRSPMNVFEPTDLRYELQ